MLAAICYPHTRLPEAQLLERVRRLGGRRPRRAACTRTSASARTAGTSPGRAFERTGVPLRRPRRLRRVPRPATSPHADDRMAAAHTASRLRDARRRARRRTRRAVTTKRWNARRRCTPRSSNRSPSKPRTRCRSGTACATSMQMNAREAMHLLRAAQLAARPSDVSTRRAGDASSDRGTRRTSRDRGGDAIRRPRNVRSRASGRESARPRCDARCRAERDANISLNRLTCNDARRCWSHAFRRPLDIVCGIEADYSSPLSRRCRRPQAGEAGRAGVLLRGRGVTKGLGGRPGVL